MEPVNYYLLDEEDFSNASDVGAIVQGAGMAVQGLGNVAQSMSKSQLGKDITAVCGTKPKFFKRKELRDKYAACAKQYQDTQIALQQQQLDIQKQQIQSTVDIANTQKEMEIQKSMETGNKKFLGMPIWAGVLVSFFGLSTVVTITYLFARRH